MLSNHSLSFIPTSTRSPADMDAHTRSGNMLRSCSDIMPFPYTRDQLGVFLLGSSKTARNLAHTVPACIVHTPPGTECVRKYIVRPKGGGCAAHEMKLKLSLAPQHGEVWSPVGAAVATVVDRIDHAKRHTGSLIEIDKYMQSWCLCVAPSIESESAVYDCVQIAALDVWLCSKDPTKDRALCAARHFSSIAI